jgi:hypothetical protein
MLDAGPIDTVARASVAHARTDVRTCCALMAFCRQRSASASPSQGAFSVCAGGLTAEGGGTTSGKAERCARDTCSCQGADQGVLARRARIVAPRPCHVHTERERLVHAHTIFCGFPLGLRMSET